MLWHLLLGLLNIEFEVLNFLILLLYLRLQVLDSNILSVKFAVQSLQVLIDPLHLHECGR